MIHREVAKANSSQYASGCSQEARVYAHYHENTPTYPVCNDLFRKYEVFSTSNVYSIIFGKEICHSISLQNFTVSEVKDSSSVDRNSRSLAVVSLSI